MRYIFPRLGRGVALSQLEVLREYSLHDPENISELARFHHPNSAPSPTGGTVVSISQLEDIRHEVLSEIGDWKNKIIGKSASTFDSRLGTALHASLQIVPADAASEDVWSFLTLVVFPDIAYQRFPNLPDERCIGTPRNTLRKTWLRREVLGDLLTSGDPILGEDELVGLFERTALARNRELVRALAESVIGYRGNLARSEYARKLYKIVNSSTGIFLWDALTPDEIRFRIGDISNGLSDKA